MSVLLKLGIGGTSISAFLVGGYFLYEHINVYWQPLLKDAQSEDYNNKFANDYKDLLTGLDNSNNRWWGLSFDELKETTTITTNKFSELKTGQGKTFEDLKNACKEAYKAEKANVNDNVQNSDTTKYKESEVWRFCSPVRTIANVKEETYAESNYGSTKKDKLVAIKNNDEFWKYKLSKLSQESNSSSSDSSKFKELKSGNITVEQLKRKCKEAYMANSSTDTTNYPETDVMKFCSISTSTTTSSG